MAYSKKLIQQVKELYPDFDRMIELAEKGDYFLGRYLDDSASGSISFDEILSATSLEELQKKAMIEKRKVLLYNMWCNETR